MPSTRPPGPTRWASRRVVSPGPQQASQAAGVRWQADLAENPRGRGFPVPRLRPQPLVFPWRVPQRVGVWPPSDLGGGADPLLLFCSVTSAPPTTRTSGERRASLSPSKPFVSLHLLRYGLQAGDGGGTGLAGRCRDGCS